MNDKGEILVLTYITVLLCMYIGVLTHYIMMRSSKRSSVSLFTYIALGDKTGILLKLATLLSSSWTFCKQSTGVNNLNVELIFAKLQNGIMSADGIDIMFVAITTGYMMDSMVNNLRTAAVKKS